MCVHKCVLSVCISVLLCTVYLASHHLVGYVSAWVHHGVGTTSNKGVSNSLIKNNESMNIEET